MLSGSVGVYIKLPKFTLELEKKKSTSNPATHPPAGISGNLLPQPNQTGGLVAPEPSKKNEEVIEFELKQIGEKVSGEGFGEIALIQDDCKRTATIIAGEEGCHMAVMTKKDYQELLGTEVKIKLK